MKNTWGVRRGLLELWNSVLPKNALAPFQIWPLSENKGSRQRFIGRKLKTNARSMDAGNSSLKSKSMVR